MIKVLAKTQLHSHDCLNQIPALQIELSTFAPIGSIGLYRWDEKQLFTLSHTF